MKKLVLLITIVLLLALPLSGCNLGVAQKQGPLLDPATVLLNNGFTAVGPYSLCSSPCIKFAYSAPEGNLEALVFTNGTFDLFVQVRDKPPFDLMQKILTEAFPLDLVGKIMSAVKDSKSEKGTTGNYDWMVDVSSNSIGIGIKPK